MVSTLTSNSPTTIAIVGAGFSGSLVAAHLLKTATRPLIIKLIERSQEIGKGIAYGTQTTGHLLNVSAGKMSAFPMIRPIYCVGSTITKMPLFLSSRLILMRVVLFLVAFLGFIFNLSSKKQKQQPLVMSV